MHGFQLSIILFKLSVSAIARLGVDVLRWDDTKKTLLILDVKKTGYPNPVKLNIILKS